MTRREPDERQHRRRGDPAVDPGRSRGRIAAHESEPLGDKRELRSVDGRRVAPVGAHDGVGGIAGKRARRHHVRVRVVNGTDPPVGPVGVDVGRQEDRAGEGSELDHDREAHDGDKRCCSPGEREGSDDVQGEAPRSSRRGRATTSSNRHRHGRARAARPRDEPRLPRRRGTPGFRHRPRARSRETTAGATVPLRRQAPTPGQAS